MLHLFTVLLLSAAPAAEWNFDDNTPGDWIPNGHLANVSLAEGILHCEGIDTDPFFNNRAMNFPATPWQCVKIRLRATKPGRAELFWSGTLDGEQGGLSQAKATSFQVPGDGAWHELVLFPFWHREQAIRQLRLDVYDAASFDIDWMRVEDLSEGRPPIETAGALPADSFARLGEPALSLAPPLKVDVALTPWITIQASAPKPVLGTLLWATDDGGSLQEESFEIKSGTHPINIEAQGIPGWKGHLVALALRLPADEGVSLEGVELRDTPGGAAELVVSYLGIENGLCRAGMPFTILAAFQNIGGEAAGLQDLRLEASSAPSPGNALHIFGGPVPADAPALQNGSAEVLRWTAMAANPGYPGVVLTQGGKPIATAFLRIDPPISLPTSAVKTILRESKVLTPLQPAAASLPERILEKYVGAPQPVPTAVDVAMYYFPGWDNVAKWDPIRRSARNRKPVLGYYDESLPQIVDWQIKWARENGVSCFLVDWYWVAGSRHLEHWFDAYRKAEYRDQLEVAIMWANHNPPNTHTRDDWRAVTKEWIERYFNLPAYYKIEGKPAIFLWDPSNLRRDLGSSEEVRAALEESREMARAAGYDGIYFATLFGHESPARARELIVEGYDGMTNYHEWGRAEALAKDPKQLRFEDVVSTANSVWEEKEAYSGELDYFPVADTGWDARPWHGNKSMVISGRNPALFRDLLEELRNFAERHHTPLVVLGPANEWGEGSYVEPCAEYGFDMLEAVRSTFATSPATTWPQNFGPADIGLGGYDLPEPPPTRRWTFDKDAGGWTAMMGIDKVTVANGKLSFQTVSADPALVVGLREISASSARALNLRVAATAEGVTELHGQLFWAVGQGGTSEATSVPFVVPCDGQIHPVSIPLAGHPRWRGVINQLRLDPGSVSGVQFSIDEIRFED